MEKEKTLTVVSDALCRGSMVKSLKLEADSTYWKGRITLFYEGDYEKDRAGCSCMKEKLCAYCKAKRGFPVEVLSGRACVTTADRYKNVLMTEDDVTEFKKMLDAAWAVAEDLNAVIEDRFGFRQQ